MSLFTLWIDADALPRMLRELLFRVSDRHELQLVFVANQPLGIAPSRRIRCIQVLQGADVADWEIVNQMQPGDLVITQDIPLAAQVVAKGGTALNPRGELYTEANIRERLSIRDYMEGLRGAGVQTGGPAAMSERERKKFADALEAVIVRLKRVASNKVQSLNSEVPKT